MRWAGLGDRDARVFWVTVGFVEGRLRERSTLEWAMALSAGREPERRAVAHVLHDGGTSELPEPWRTAWELVEASWSGMEAAESGVSAYSIGRRVGSGERSSELVSSIVDLVEPRLEVRRVDPPSGGRPRRLKGFGDLVSASLTSGSVADAADLGLAELDDADFLQVLANALDASLRRGLALGRRIGWDGRDEVWRLGMLYRVDRALDAEDGDDADSFHRGIAPVVKLLHAVASRLAETGPDKLAPLLQGWRRGETAVDLRLWAALAKRADLVGPRDVGEFLVGLDGNRFWNVHVHPEVALLRAGRFRELNPAVRRQLTRRLRRGPPRKLFRWETDPARVDDAREYWAARELQRIAVCGGELAERDGAWLSERLGRFGDLRSMGAEEGFLGGTGRARIIEGPMAKADTRFDGMGAELLLDGLERMLGEAVDSEVGSTGRAWVGKRDNLSNVLAELDKLQDGADAYPRLLAFVLQTLARTTEGGNAKEAAAVLRILSGIAPSTVAVIAGDIAEWLGRWHKAVVVNRAWTDVWLEAWPAVVAATNAIYRREDIGRLNVVVPTGGDDEEPEDLDAWNTPVASMLDVFLAACPTVGPAHPEPFDDSALGRVREALVASGGQALVIVRHRLIAQLPYFIQADRDWAEANLVAPLLTEEAGRLALWRAVARANLRREALGMIGNEVADQAANTELGRRTRSSLVFSVVVDSMFALLDGEKPAVDAARVQQVLRIVEEDIRSDAADAVVRFVRDVSKARGDSGAAVFHAAAKPFLEQVWPRERTLATAGVSRALAELPAESGSAFDDAVAAIERFLVPFPCYSLLDYGLHGEDEEGQPKLDVVDDGSKGRALLRLLDLTVGRTVGSPVPHELREVLDRLRSMHSELADLPEYRRLATAAGH